MKKSHVRARMTGRRMVRVRAQRGISAMEQTMDKNCEAKLLDARVKMRIRAVSTPRNSEHTSTPTGCWKDMYRVG